MKKSFNVKLVNLQSPATKQSIVVEATGCKEALSLAQAACRGYLAFDVKAVPATA